MSLRLVPGKTYFRHIKTGLVWGYNELYKNHPQFEEFVYGGAEEASSVQQPIVVVEPDSPSEPQRPQVSASDDISDILSVL